MEIVGELVPLTVLPRFTSFIGPDTYSTAPMRVDDFYSADVTFWRGPLVVSGAPLTPFSTTFEESHDATTWTAVGSSPSGPVTTANTYGHYKLVFRKRWFRVKVVLDAAEVSGEKYVGITLWMSGVLQMRVAQS